MASSLSGFQLFLLLVLLTLLVSFVVSAYVHRGCCVSLPMQQVMLIHFRLHLFHSPSSSFSSPSSSSSSRL